MSGSTTTRGPIGTGNYGVNLGNGDLVQYVPPNVLTTAAGSTVTYGTAQTLAAGEAPTGGTGIWQVTSGDIVAGASGATLVPVTIS